MRKPYVNDAAPDWPESKIQKTLCDVAMSDWPEFKKLEHLCDAGVSDWPELRIPETWDKESFLW